MKLRYTLLVSVLYPSYSHGMLNHELGDQKLCTQLKNLELKSDVDAQQVRLLQKDCAEVALFMNADLQDEWLCGKKVLDAKLSILQAEEACLREDKNSPAKLLQVYTELGGKQKVDQEFAAWEVKIILQKKALDLQRKAIDLYRTTKIHDLIGICQQFSEKSFSDEYKKWKNYEEFACKVYHRLVEQFTEEIDCIVRPKDQADVPLYKVNLPLYQERLPTELRKLYERTEDLGGVDYICGKLEIIKKAIDEKNKAPKEVFLDPFADAFYHHSNWVAEAIDNLHAHAKNPEMKRIWDFLRTYDENIMNGKATHPAWKWDLFGASDENLLILIQDVKKIFPDFPIDLSIQKQIEENVQKKSVKKEEEQIEENVQKKSAKKEEEQNP